MHQKNIFNLLR